MSILLRVLHTARKVNNILDFLKYSKFFLNYSKSFKKIMEITLALLKNNNYFWFSIRPLQTILRVPQSYNRF